MEAVAALGDHNKRAELLFKVDQSMLVGTLPELRAGANNIVLGRALAQRLGVTVGQRVTLIIALTAS